MEMEIELDLELELESEERADQNGGEWVGNGALDVSLTAATSFRVE